MLTKMLRITVLSLFALLVSGATGINPLIAVPAVVVYGLVTVPEIGALAAVSATSAFIGTNRSQFITDLVFGNQTMQAGLLHMIPNKHDKIYLPIVKTAADQLQDRQANPDTSNDSAYTEKTIDPKDMQWFQKFNPEVFEHVWAQFWPTGRLARESMNATVLSVILQTINKSLNNQIDRVTWQGDTTLGALSPLRFFDGFLKGFEADADVTKVPGAVIDAANVIAELEKVVAACRDEVKNMAIPVIIMSHADFAIYQAAARNLSFKGTNITEGIQNRFGGFRIAPVVGMPKNNIVMTDANTSPNSNLLAGTWLPNEKDNLIVERWRPESEEWFILTKFRLGVQWARSEDVVFYRPNP